MYILIITVVLLILLTAIYMQHPRFGKLPAGERMASIKVTENYIDGAFQNQSFTPDRPDGVSFGDVLHKFVFGEKTDLKPKGNIPSVKTSLNHLDPEEDVLIWFGHSSYFIQVNQTKILVDPVLSGSASPLPFGTKSFAGTDIYSVEDMPHIDFLFITHDHYDHLDYETIIQIKPKIKNVICGLGVGAHLEKWGYDYHKIIEKNWNEKVALNDQFTVHWTPARHFSGRGLKRSQSLWTSYVLEVKDQKIFIGGDSGYDTHFQKIGETFGKIDLAILENGQYDEHWPYLHMLPDEVLLAAKDLNAERVLPVHSGKFVLANHPWYEPLDLIYKNSLKENIRVSTPMIGEIMYLNKKDQQFSTWWKDVQ